ncbi:hypothetical protein TERTU_4470 [Teredinibacter turnerae T7901]|uniref:Lipoprotein n=1 Tax=Teredinibacter turnerae (strain ATCC 39867 / T7901) TaxID=377629 RepID=C6AR53_TERTT|nr:hypothetical protein [Teredinibacter turnerae]ACS93597.1 hypothetical protein TERTU_4470 [Teredinibacter turnerae T7901]
MKYLVLFFLLPLSVYASDSIFPHSKKGAVEKHEKVCKLQNLFNHKAMFYKSELCTYGTKGCDIGEVKEPFEVLCDLEYVTMCYGKKSWLNRNQYFQLSNDVVVANISHSITVKNGVKTSTVCAHYK